MRLQVKEPFNRDGHEIPVGLHDVRVEVATEGGETNMPHAVYILEITKPRTFDPSHSSETIEIDVSDLVYSGTLEVLTQAPWHSGQ